MVEATLNLSEIVQLTIAGWAGRDSKAVEKHIRELEALGVPRPRRTPIFYRVAASLLTTSDTIEVIGDASSGEVEPVLIARGGELWVAVGSDHTDRKLETINITASKQICAKPVSRKIWRFADIADRWDQLEIRSTIVVGGERRSYQQSKLAALRSPKELISLSTGSTMMSEGSAMFCGTFPVLGGITPADRFEMELHDPVAKRSLTAAYSIRTLLEQD